MQIFTSIDEKSFNFFKLNGYCHFRLSDPDFMKNIDEAFIYYDNTSIKAEVAFRNEDGCPRQYIDVFSDPSSPALIIYRSNAIKEIVNRFGLVNQKKYSPIPRSHLKIRTQLPIGLPIRIMGIN